MFGNAEEQRVTAVVLDVKDSNYRTRSTNWRGESHSTQRATFIVEVRPPGVSPFRVETKATVSVWHAPQVGDEVQVDWKPGTNDVEMVIKGDHRYDWKLIRAQRKEQDSARREALLAGRPAPPESSGDPEIDLLEALEAELGS